MRKVIHKKLATLISASVGVSLIGVLPVFADSVTYSTPYSETATGYKLDGDVTVNVNVAEINALEMTLSTNNLIIDLAPHIGAPSFDTDTLNILVGTTNATGYTLTMASSYDGAETTSLTRTESISGTNPTIDSIENTLTPTDFASSSNTNSINKWGYLLGTTNLDIDKTFYNPILTTNTINSSTEPVYNDPTSITFGAKVNSELPAGNYRATLKFTAVANYVPMTFARAYDIAGKSKTEYNGEEYYTMQDMNSNICSAVDNLEAETLIDIRDNNTYSVAKIAGYCFMTQNLRITGNINNTTKNSNFTANSFNTCVSDLASGDSYSEARCHNSGNTTTGVWYNYAAATAGTITGENNISFAEQDICAANWKIPDVNIQNAIRDVSIEAYKPVTGGYYIQGGVMYPENGYWWSSRPTAGGEYRYYQTWDGAGVLHYSYFLSRGGAFVRCIAK